MATLDLNQRINNYKKSVIEHCFLNGKSLGKPLMCLDFFLCTYLGLLSLEEEKLGDNYLIVADPEYYISAGLMLDDFNDEKKLKENIFTVLQDLGGLENLSYGAGKAYNLKLSKKKGKVFVFLDAKNVGRSGFFDMVMLASKLNLQNLVVVLFNNDGKYILSDKFKGFEWQFLDVREGHDFDKIFDALSYVWSAQRKPICISVNTTVAKGIPFLEGQEKAFYSKLSEQEFEELKRLEIC